MLESFPYGLKNRLSPSKAYDSSRDIICQIPPEMGYPPDRHPCSYEEPAYGGTAPRHPVLGIDLTAIG